MKTLQEIEHERLWTVFAVICLFMAMCFGAIAFGYFALYMWILERTGESAELLALALAAVLIGGCVAPGLLVWRKLRSRSRYAALYGLALAATVSIGAPMLLGAPLGVNPRGALLENLVF